MRAIISVSDKTGIVDFARALQRLGIEIYATGGTEELLRASGLQVQSIQDLTQFPEILGGRVKTLHPGVHGGILALRANEEHLAELTAHGLKTVEMVVVNLYPFLKTVEAGADLAAALENVDIGGQTLLRAAAKNFASVIPVCDPADYDSLLEDLGREDGVSMETRRRLAAKAFQYCALYDTHVASYLRPSEDIFPTRYTVALERVVALRSGENPHQLAAVYMQTGPRARSASILAARQVHGGPISFNNTYDADMAWQAVSDFASPCVAIVKHGNPCGISLGDSVAEAYRRALATDPPTAFGGAVASNRVVDEDAAHEIAAVFFEDLVAPGFTPGALEVLRQKQDLRVFAVNPQASARPASGPGAGGSLDYTSIVGGFLVQTPDALPEHSFTPTVVTRRQPVLGELTSLYFAWRAVKHVHSHAIVLARGLSTVGIGAGQTSRLDAVDIACRKAGDRGQGAVLASDGFFPFADGVERAADAGVTALIQPGGSRRDPEIIRVADRRGLAMIFTGERHYRH